MIRRIIAYFLVIAVLFSLLIVPAFAETDNFTVNGELNPNRDKLILTMTLSSHEEADGWGFIITFIGECQGTITPDGTETFYLGASREENGKTVYDYKENETTTASSFFLEFWEEPESSPLVVQIALAKAPNSGAVAVISPVPASVIVYQDGEVSAGWPTKDWYVMGNEEMLSDTIALTGNGIATPSTIFSVTTTLGQNMNSSGTLEQTDLEGAMTPVVVTPESGYLLSAPTISPANAGITATANNDGSYTISGTPTASVTVTFQDAINLANATTITADTSEVAYPLYPGDTFTVPVVIANNPGFASYVLKATYETSALTLTGITNGDVTPSLTSVNPETGLVNVSGATDVSTNGTLFNLAFTVKDGATAGNYNIAIALSDGDEDNFSNAAQDNVSVVFVSGTVTVALPHTVTFQSGEAVVGTYPVKDGQKLTALPADPSKDYHDFQGWSKDGTTVIPNDTILDTAVTADVTYQAVFAPASYDVTLNVTTGTDTQTITGTATYNSPYEATIPGYDTAKYTYTLASVTVGGTEISKPDISGEGKITIPGASITGAVVLNVTATPKQYSVTLGEGLEGTSGENAATYGSDYEATITGYDTSKYSYTVTATVGGENYAAAISSEGKITIPGTSITGDIVITATATPKSYDVTLTGLGGENSWEGGTTATYGTPYVATIKGYDTAKFTYTLDKATVNGENYAVAIADNGTVTIQGENIIGAIEIKATATPKTYDVELGTGLTGPNGATGADQATYGTDYTVTVTNYDGEHYANTVSATVGGSSVAVTDNLDGTFTIAGSVITGKLTVTWSSAANTYKATLTGLTSGAAPTYNTDYVATITAYDAANYTYTVTATVGGASYNPTVSGATVTIPGADVTGDIVITATATPKSYDVTLTGLTGAATATYDTDYTATISPYEPEKYDYSVTATIGGDAYEPTVSGNAVTIPGKSIKGDVELTVSKTNKTYTVTLGEGLKGAATATYGTDYSFSATNYDSAHFENTVRATVGGVSVAVTDNGDGTFKIAGSAITGDLSITWSSAANTYDVTLTGLTGDATATYGADYTATIKDYDTAKYTYSVTATVGGASYNPTVSGATVKIPGAAVTGDITITATATPRTYDVTLTGLTGAATATYDTDYTATISDYDAARYTYTVTATVGGASVNAGVTGDSVTVKGSVITGDLKITATAEARSYTVQTEVTGSGTLTVDPTSATADTEITVTATPDEGGSLQSLVYVVEDDVFVITLDGDTGSFFMPAADVTVKAEFEQLAGDKLTPTVTAPKAVTGLVYTGDEQTLITAGSTTGGTLVYALSENGAYSEALPSGVDAGSYTVWYRVDGDDEYKDVEAKSLTVTIAKADPVVTAPKAVSGLTYTGDEQKLIKAGSTDGGALVYSLSENGTYSKTIPTGEDAGSYTVWYKVEGDGNYNDVAAKSLTATIAKADPVVTAPKAVTGLTYTGSAQTLITAGSTTGGTLVYALSESGAYSEALPTGTTVGRYTVWYKVNGDDNYNDVAAESLTVSIASSGGGGGTGGGGGYSGGGGSSGGSEPSTGSTAVVEAESGSSEVAIPYTLEDGTVTLDMDENVTDRLAGSSDELVTLDASDVDDATELVIPAEAAEKLADAEKSLEVILPEGSVTLDETALAAAVRENEPLHIIVEDASDDLNERQKAVVGDRPVVDIRIVSGGEELSSFNGGVLTIRLPYTLKPGENPNNIKVYYLDDRGNIEEMRAIYDAKSKCVIFSTTHLSLYYVAYEEWVNVFSDVKESDWFYDAVEFVSQKGLFHGTDRGFEPSLSMTRAMMVTVLYNYVQPAAGTYKASFTDVPEGMWYSDPIAWASSVGIVKGDGDGTFRPNDAITRQEAMVMLLRFARYQNKAPAVIRETALDFADAGSVADWASEAVAWATSEGIIHGKGNNILDPKGTATRAEFAQMIKNYLETTI